MKLTPRRTTYKPPLIPPYRNSVTSVLPKMGRPAPSVARFKLKLLQLFHERGKHLPINFPYEPLGMTHLVRPCLLRNPTQRDSRTPSPQLVAGLASPDAREPSCMLLA